MLALNFPEFNFKLEIQGQKKLIFDIIRKKFIPLTPEEWVRQHVIHTCIFNYNLSAGLLAIEKEIRFENLKKRFDVAVLNNRGEALLLVECKAPDIKIDGQTWFQSSIYQNSLKARYLWLTNGLVHHWVEFDGEGYRSVEMPAVLFTNS